ncbi:roundabout homolog 1-like [Diorhabda sublineata]|uniref:roundabout homolog 1-like n=1 Tax=Diorhabda sublineata TaxID=1163346 RepID=UPI0024E180F4|nr:roundabout homolog 1-like [Diorhabda sublineata]
MDWSAIIRGIIFWMSFHITEGYHHAGHQPPRITEHPVDTTVARHDPATLNCNAQGDPEPSITWYKDGQVLRTAPQDARSHRVLLPAGSLFFLRVAQSRKETDAGTYWCEASNILGKARSRNATLTVAVLRDEFRFEPQSSRVAAGEDIVLECSPPKGVPEPQVSWRKDGETLTVEGRLKLVDGYNLAITDTKTTDDGKYQCVAKNTAGVRESTAAVLKVYVKPFMIRPPEDVTALVGSTVEFTCATGGDPIPDVLWRRTSPGGTMPLGRVRVLEDRTLRLEQVILSDQGRYYCDADNFAGAITASAVLTVHAPPTFTIKPQAQAVEAGRDVNFHCAVRGSPPPFVFWSFEGDRSLIYTGSKTGNYEAFTTDQGSSTLSLKEAQVQDSGTVVICAAVNAAGSVSSRTRLTVTSKEDRPPPIIITGPGNQTLPIDSVAYMSCEADGNPEPVISWYKEGIPVTPSTRINMSNPNHLELYGLRKEDSGSYTCVASSKSGKSTWTGYLLVENPKNPNINFFKAPEVIMLPGAPSRPHPLNQSEDSVTITWSQNNKIGSSSLLGYQIELFGKEEGVTPTWTVVGRRITNLSFTQHLLSPGVAYSFLIRAENAHGIGPPSQLSEPVVVGADSSRNWGNPEVTELSEARANLVTASVAKLTDAIPLSSTSIKLMWLINDSTYVEGLYIYFITLDIEENKPKTYSMLTVLHTVGTSSFSVNNLDKWARYEFFLVPFFKTVEGLPSNSIITRTLEDVPTEAPSQMEAILLNSTAVYLKWKPPPAVTLNGELQGYKVEIKTNGSDQMKVMSVGKKSPNLLLGSLSPGVSYFVRVAALTRIGLGPYNSPATLRLEPTARISDNNFQRPIGADLQSGDFITETWFMALLISMVSVMILLFGAMIIVRRRQMLSKKNLTPSRSNGAVLATPLDVKHEPPLWLNKENLPEYSTNTLPDYSKLTPRSFKKNDYLLNGINPYGSVNLRSNPLNHAEFPRPDNLQYSSEKCYPVTGRKFDDYLNMQIQEYASPNVESKVADYAEVNSNLTANIEAVSPAPYATTTLVGKRSQWNNFNTDVDDECPYPSANGGYYNRKVYSDSYFSPIQTLRRNRNGKKLEQNPPDIVSPSSSTGQPVYARVGPPGLSWRNDVPSMSSFTPHKQVYHHGSSRSEPGNI